jgi:hypothetical protein
MIELSIDQQAELLGLKARVQGMTVEDVRSLLLDLLTQYLHQENEVKAKLRGEAIAP